MCPKETAFIFPSRRSVGGTSEFLVWIGYFQVRFNNLTHDHIRFEKYFLSTNNLYISWKKKTFHFSQDSVRFSCALKMFKMKNVKLDFAFEYKAPAG